MYIVENRELIIVVRVEDPNTKLNKFVLIGWVCSSRGRQLNASAVKVSQNTRKGYSIPISLPWPSSSRDTMCKSRPEAKQTSTPPQSSKKSPTRQVQSTPKSCPNSKRPHNQNVVPQFLLALAPHSDDRRVFADRGRMMMAGVMHPL
jgi:hypothetical protein